ncbi:MAG TPA: peptidase M48, partial [Rhodanobacteraceae bacterium]|nr:peptidase M48 [Rhodanobacteraceae bacterium]
DAAARRAYLAAIADALPGRAMLYAPPDDWIGALDRALPRLDRLAPAGKSLVIEALVRAIGADGEVCVAEAELLRTIAAALHCPLPPLLASAA